VKESDFTECYRLDNILKNSENTECGVTGKSMIASLSSATTNVLNKVSNGIIAQDSLGTHA
jgi:hypothetical protein